MMKIIVCAVLLQAGQSHLMFGEEVCNLKPEVGPCERTMTRFFYDPDTKSCQEFTYGGCGANANTFKTIAKCEEKCFPDCQLKPKVGPCKGHFPRYFYDTVTETCKEFTYGGCRGNSNSFPTIAECEKACVSPCQPL